MKQRSKLLNSTVKDINNPIGQDREHKPSGDAGGADGSSGSVRGIHVSTSKITEFYIDVCRQHDSPSSLYIVYLGYYTFDRKKLVYHPRNGDTNLVCVKVGVLAPQLMIR